MKISVYIASASQENARSLRDFLVNSGFEVCASWLSEDNLRGWRSRGRTDEDRSAIALADEADIAKADAFVSISETYGVRVPGGKHVELGIAIALGKPVIVLGRMENVFYWHPSVRVVADESAVVAELDRLKKKSSDDTLVPGFPH